MPPQSLLIAANSIPPACPWACTVYPGTKTQAKQTTILTFSKPPVSRLLKLLKPGERGVIASLNTRSEKVLQKLKTMGLKPGRSLTLEQSFPRFIIRVGSDRFALDDLTRQAITVRPF
jgi:ferrous iron transport protein A